MLTTVNVQHLESVNDVVTQITGTVQRETVPDEIVRGAEQVELVDMTPEALRRRMAHGNVYRAGRIDAAQWEHVFLPFRRLGDRDNQTGVGLGLTLSRGLAEAMGGDVTRGSPPVVY